MTESVDNLPAVSSPPARLDDAYVRKTLHAIKQAQAKQATIEAERTGASKMTARLVTVFGSIITAAAIGGFVWVWDAQSTNAAQDSAIEQLEQNPHASHGHVKIAADQLTSERRVDGIERAQRTITERIDRNERADVERHREVLEELRRLRTTRRTWGGR